MQLKAQLQPMRRTAIASSIDATVSRRGPGVCQRSRCAVVSLNACLVRVRAFQEIRHE